MQANSLKSQDFPVYDGSDLGLTYTPQYSMFKLWSPIAQEVTLRFYKEGIATSDNKDLIETVKMVKGDKGIWSHTAQDDRKGQYYTLQVTTLDGKTMMEVPDIYAKAVGANGKRAQIIDLKETNPKGWESDKSPQLAYKTDAIIYELHVRDASIAKNSGIKKKGKFLGLTQEKSKNDAGLLTGLSHIKDLGVTHVQLLPFYDFFTVDEAENAKNKDYKKYNWGYDPLNYNTPEGSYSTDPFDGKVRIEELKKVVQSFHKNGLRVIMDVVYNHTMFGEESYFHQLVPFYYHRTTSEGKFSNASACGNETASDKPMMRKFMLESLKYWVNEYHIDGFRFDLMGIHDIETMNMISTELHKIKPDIVLLGEGWTAGDSPLPENQRSLKKYTYRLDKIAAFSDDMRDGLKGSVFAAEDRGFVSGKKGMEESVKFGIIASTKHPQIDYSKVNYSKEPWAAEPYQCINYAECHDNHTLWDRFLNSNPKDTEGDRIKMHKLTQAIVLTSQGIPFIHAGMEFLRTKKGVENSYNSPDDINEIDWNRKTQYAEVNSFIKNLIEVRKKHPAFRMPATELIVKNLEFMNMLSKAGTTEGVIGYTLNGKAVGDKWKTIVVLFNANAKFVSVDIPKAKWKVICDGEKVLEKGLKDFKGNRFDVPALSAVILVQ